MNRNKSRGVTTPPKPNNSRDDLRKTPPPPDRGEEIDNSPQKEADSTKKEADSTKKEADSTSVLVSGVNVHIIAIKNYSQPNVESTAPVGVNFVSSAYLMPDYKEQNTADNIKKAASASITPAQPKAAKEPKAAKPPKPTQPSENAKIAALCNKAGEVAVLTAEPVIRPGQIFISPVLGQPSNDREIFIQNLRNTFKMTCGDFTAVIDEEKLEVSFPPIDFVTAAVETSKLFSDNNTNYGAEILVTQLKKIPDVKPEQEQECKNLKIFDRSSLNKFIKWSPTEILEIKYRSNKASSSEESSSEASSSEARSSEASSSEASSSEASSSGQPKDTNPAPKQAAGGPGEARLAYRLGSNVNGDSFSYDMLMGISSENGGAPKCHKVEVKQLDTDGSFNTGIKVKKYAELNFFNRIKPLIANLDNLYKDAKLEKFNLLQNMDNILIRVLSLIEKCFTEGLTEAAEGFFMAMNFVLMFLHNIKEQVKNIRFTIDDTPIDLLTCYQMYLPMKHRVNNTPHFDEIIEYKGSEQIALLLYYLDHEFINEPVRLQVALNNLLTPFVEENIKLALVNENGFIILDNILDKENAFVVFLRITKGAIRFKLMGRAYIKMMLSSDEIPDFEILTSKPNQENLLASIFGRIGLPNNIDQTIEDHKFMIEQSQSIKDVQMVKEFIESYNAYIKKVAALTTPKGKKKVPPKDNKQLGVKIYNRYKLYFR